MLDVIKCHRSTVPSLRTIALSEAGRGNGREPAGCTRPRVGGVATTGNSRLPVVLPVVLPVIPALMGHYQGAGLS